MRNVAEMLVAVEARPDEAAGMAAVRVCDKLGRSLSVLAGASGYHSLLTRALGLAAAEVAWLGGLKIAADGTMTVPGELQAEMAKREAAEGGRVLVTKLLELLVTFIGEALTLRLVQRAWPKAALNQRNPGEKP